MAAKDLSIATASYGTWNSPLSAEMIARGSVTPSDLMTDGNDTYWVETRPANKGQNTIVRLNSEGKLHDVTPPDFSARTFVHEYGGKSYTVSKGQVYFFNAMDSAIYLVSGDAKPRRITKEKSLVSYEGKTYASGVYFGDLQFFNGNLIAVGEEVHPGKTSMNFLAFIDVKTGDYKKIATGSDFYAYPTISSDHKKIAWISWNHPDMPWTRAVLWSADISPDGTITDPRLIAGTTFESIMQPAWSPDGVLYFVTDRDKGWWNIHRYKQGKIENMTSLEAEVGEPLWVLGRSSYAFLKDHILFSFNRDGRWHLALCDPETKKHREIATSAVYLHQFKSSQNGVRYLEGYADKNDAVMEMSMESDLPHTLYQYPSTLSNGYISVPKHIACPCQGRMAFAYYYPPQNQDYQAPASEKPPLIVMIHGGPTSQAKRVFSLKQQFWTSRGFAILDVNYGGSTGYGRAYRSLLDKNWGIVDVADCISSAKYLVEKGLADPNRLVIRGGSAGGYTTLAVLASTSIFKAGASYYGVADITVLAHDTHKFESRYMEELVGKYPEEKSVWIARSPITSVDKIKTPLIIFQGEEDIIVPKNQSVMIYEALKAKGVQSEIYIYPNEGHGFRQAPTISDSLQKELEFYLKVFQKR